MFSFIRPFIFNLDPEKAHDLAIKSLKYNFLPSHLFSVRNEEILNTKLFGREIANPIGLAAGFDKSAEVYNEIFKIGFGFVEVGTITPKRQFGNPKPRIFRLEKDQALINRLGFNNDGLEKISKRISKNKPSKILGVNIGPNRDTRNKIDDFIICLSELHSQADYITINISSPNTEGLRDFHEKKSLSKLLEKLNSLKLKKKINKPLFIKISPDIDDEDISQINEIILRHNINGIIISNSTDRNRAGLYDNNKNEEGGLSGLPLKDLSTKLIKRFYRETKGKIQIIGVGGVDSGQSTFEKIISGANAVQLYTGMIYKGPGIVKEIKKELIKILNKEKIKNITAAIGINS